MTVIPLSSHSTWRRLSWRAKFVTFMLEVSLHSAMNLALMASLSLVVMMYHVWICVTIVLMVRF